MKIETETEPEESFFVQCIILIVGLFHVGLISGYIPSPLYPRGQYWPREYQIFQVVLFGLTLTRLTNVRPKYIEEEPEDLWLDDFASMANWMGYSLEGLFSEGKFFSRLSEDFFAFGCLFIVAKLIARIEDKNKKDQMNKKEAWIGFILLRNFIFFVILTYYLVDDVVAPGGDTFESKYCAKINPEEDFLPENESLKDNLVGFAEAWKQFHPSYLWSVRTSHAVLYPSILLLLSRRRISDFLIWTIYLEIDIFHLLADMFHYASGPELASERLEFQEDPALCFVGIHMMQVMVAYPLNFVYLTTKYGDTNVTELLVE